MKVILVMVVSADGRFTDGDTSWASQEDKNHFQSLKDRVGVVIIGRKTYQVIQNFLVLSTKIRRIVVTSSPEKFNDQSVSGQLEFTNETPKNLVTRLEKEGVKEVLLAGGTHLNTSFLREQLIHEFYITVEPKLFGTGKSLFHELPLKTNLHLIEVNQLNAQGTILLHYKVENS